MERSLSNQMEMFDPIEVPDLSVPPIDKELQDLSKQAIDELPKDVGVGALTSPITAAADVVDVGASMPDPKAGTEFMSPIYSALEETFDQLSSAGINRENAEKLIKEVTGIELKGNLGELIGEGVGLPIAALSKAGTSIVSAVAKHGDKLDNVLAEAKNIFRTASGGDDFDGMAPAVAGDVKAQTDQLIAKTDLPDTSISPNIDAARSAQQELQEQQAKLDDAELIQSRAESGPEYETFSDFEADIANAKNKNDGKTYKEFFEEDAEVAYIVELPDNKKAQAKKDWDNVKTVKEVDDWFKKYDTQPVRQGYNPEDPASRVFHLTKKDYDVADVVGSGINADIGFHVGTAAQATARGSTNIKYDKELAEEMVKGERILPLVLKENLKPARIPDVSSFKEPMRWIGDMSVAKSDRQRRKFLLGDPSDAALLKKAPRVTVGGDTYFMLPDVMRIGMDEKLWKDIILQAHRAKRIGLDTVTNQADRVEWFNTLKQTANKHGYDSFVYRNEYEGTATENIDALVEQIQRAQRGEIDSNEIDLSSRFSDSYMLLEPDQAKGLFGGMTEGDPRYMKNQGGLMLQKGGATVMDRQMDMFQSGGFTVTEEDGGTRATQGNMTQTEAALMQKERESTKGLDTSESMDAAMQGLDKSIAARKRFDEMNKQLAMGAISDLSLEEKEAFVAEYKNLKEKHSFAEGGMLKEGGLEDDGGTVDPVSGNEVPPGSSKEEVRDDIPAQLSEGEFVFPADVVRYIGLEKLMMMRQQAKMGLKMMEEMGQMGNSDEATIPDDLPFGMMDLIIVDSEDEEEYNNKKEKAEGGLAMQEGGVVTPQDAGIFYQPSQFAGEANRPGVATPAPDAASRQFVQQPQQSATPTVRYEQPKTTFGEFLTPPQGGPQTITIVNKETGEERMITFIPGATEIPEGFVRKEDYVPKDIVPETETTRVETARVPETDSDNDERRRKREEEMFGPGGGRLGFKGQGQGVDLNGVQNDLIFGISFDGVNPLTGGKSILAGLATDGVIPADIAGDVTVNFKRADIEFSMTGIEYNDIKRTMQEFGSGSSEVRDKLDEYGYEKAMLEKRQKDFMESQAEKIAKEARESELAKAREIADENRRKAAINAALEKQRREAIAAAERERQYVESQGYQQDDRDDPGGFTVTDSSGQSYRTDSSGTAGAFTGDPVGMEDEYDFNTGGLAGKKKPKPKKKMKRGGLASKK